MLILMFYIRALLSDVIFCFGLTSGFGLVISIILYLYYTPDTVPTYSRSATILVQFIAFYNLVDLGSCLMYTYQASLLKILHSWSTFSFVHPTRHLL